MNNCYRGYILIAFWVCSLAVYGQTEMQAIDTLRNIRLQEVIVTATQSDAPGTRSVIGQDAIRHIQATDLSVLSQLLPNVPKEHHVSPRPTPQKMETRNAHRNRITPCY